MPGSLFRESRCDHPATTLDERGRRVCRVCGQCVASEGWR